MCVGWGVCVLRWCVFLRVYPSSACMAAAGGESGVCMLPRACEGWGFRMLVSPVPLLDMRTRGGVLVWRGLLYTLHRLRVCLRLVNSYLTICFAHFP